ncbi:MAG: alcohol dehydrogenase catalytic domain-containing protein [Actinomycetota bacterium]|nr:alcohol dehydrogenase catalytic domain-containing protein [Actinomycetota bacterium]
MKAVYYQGPGQFTVGRGQVVRPADGEVRLDVAYCGLCGTDLHIAHGSMDHRVRAPQVIGHEMAGTVAELGAGVTGLRPGDKVVVRPLDSRGETAADKGVSHICRNLKFLGIDTPGAFQSSWTVPAFTIHRLPPEVDLKVAALTEPLAVACHDVRRGRVASGETVVVIGGGPIGILISLVARSRGARVIVSEVNASRLAFVRQLGLTGVDPGESDVAQTVEDITGGAGADVVFEVSGSPGGAMVMTKLAGLRGRIVVVAIFSTPPAVNLFDVFWKELEVLGTRVYEPEDFQTAIELIIGQRLPLANMITSVEPLEQLPAALEQLERNPSAMKILVDCRA